MQIVATVTAFAVTIGFQEGFRGPLFAIVLVISCIVLGEFTPTQHASLWWKDLISCNANWFSNAVRMKLGSGMRARFWKDKWLGGSALCDSFPRLFQVAQNKETLVGESGEWINGSWEWKLTWRRPLFNWEEELLHDMQQILAGQTITNTGSDTWVWMPDHSSLFTVKSAYNHLLNASKSSMLDQSMQKALTDLWKCSIPSKVAAFVWKLLLNRLLIVSNTENRGN